jgi:RNA polymerase sigma factor (sigma-70 family)
MGSDRHRDDTSGGDAARLDMEAVQLSRRMRDTPGGGGGRIATDTNAFFDHAYPFILAAARSVCGRKHDEWIADVAQITAGHALRGLGGYRAEARFYSWVLAIARRALLKLLKKEKNTEVEATEPERRGDEERFEASATPVEGDDEELQHERRVVLEALRRAGRPGWAAVLEMRVLNGMSGKDVAAALGTTRNNVYQMQFRAMKWIRTHASELGLARGAAG